MPSKYTPVEVRPLAWNRVLKVIKEAGPLTQRELAGKLDVEEDCKSLAKTLQQLERRKVIQRALSKRGVVIEEASVREGDRPLRVNPRWEYQE